MLVSSAILYFWPAQWGGLIGFAWSMPVVVISAMTLGYRLGDTPLSWTAAGLLLFIPSIGVTVWSRRLMVMDLPYLIPHESVPHFMTIVQRELSAVPPILLSAWLASFWFKSAPVRLFLGVTAFSAIVAKHYIDSSSIALHHGDYRIAAHQLMWTELLRLFSIAALFVTWREHRKLERGLLIVLTLVAAWLITPPIWLFLKRIPVPEASPNAPVGNWGVTAGVNSANPLSDVFDEQLDSQGLSILPGWPWWCDTTPRPNWDNNRGASAIIQMDSHQTLSELLPVLPNILYRGVTRIGFVGHSETSLPDPLGQHLSKPVARWLLEPPPKETFWGEIIGTQAYFYQALPSEPEACALWAPEDINVGTLFEVSQTLDQIGGICDHKLFLAFGSPPESREIWRAPLPCTHIKETRFK